MGMEKYLVVKEYLKSISSEEKATSTRRFFRCDEKGYSNGTRFIGIRTPDLRLVAKKFFPLSLGEIHELLISEIHEERLVALFFLDLLFSKASPNQQNEIFTFYVEHFPYIRDWDLVDSSAPYIVGKYLLDKDKSILVSWAKSPDFWVRRIAIVSTWMLIRSNIFENTIEISTLLLRDEHDLIHKAVGWMLREMGKKEVALLEIFLEKHGTKMPRTMLRYAIEKFPKERQKNYLLQK